MGSLFKSKTKATKAPFESTPWGPQQSYLKQGFEAASDALGGSLGGIPNDFTADLNQTQLDAVDSLRQFGNGQAQQASQMALQAGQDFLGYGNQYNQNLTSLYGQAGQDKTGQILDTAQSYANDPYLQGQIDAALGDVNKAFNLEKAGINSGAVSTGGMGSTRAGVLEALAQDDAMDRAASISSGMRGQAYQAGIDRAMAQTQTDFTNQLVANEGLGRNSQLGLTALGQGLSMGDSGIRTALDAGGILQGQAQNEIMGQLSRTQAPLDIINEYMRAVGGSYGSKGYQSTVTKSASPFQQIIGGAATLAGLS